MDETSKSNEPEVIDFEPQPGKQTSFLTTSADIAIYGGGAGSGKSYGLLLECIRHVENPEFGAVVFRRETPQIFLEGGLWDESEKIFPYCGANGSRSQRTWAFESGATVSFEHLEKEKTKLKFQGSQIALICFDELTHFSESQFFYMLSRNRSMSGVAGYVRATTNPDPDSWVKKFIQWWIDPLTGYAIQERSGIVRWFIRVKDDLIWADSREELLLNYGGKRLPKSVTFIAASIEDNQKLLDNDPAYLANLEALPHVEFERLRKGNWNVRAGAGSYFKREWFEIVDAIPATATKKIRYWDRAATDPATTDSDPDWTAGPKISKTPDNIYYVEDMRRAQLSAYNVEQLIKNTASQDGVYVAIGIEQDPGSAGKTEAAYYIRQLSGYIVHAYPATKDKETRAKPASAQAQAGNIKILRGSWNEAFFRELENFPEGANDDQVDGLSGGFNALSTSQNFAFQKVAIPDRTSAVSGAASQRGRTLM